MNSEVSRHKYENFVKRVSVGETMDLFTEVLSSMYEADQHHREEDPLNIFREKLGLGKVNRDAQDVDHEELEQVRRENQQLH